SRRASRSGRTSDLAQLPVARMGLIPEQVAELLFRLLFHFRARCIHWRKVGAPLEGPGGVDDGPRAVALAILRDPRVERSAPCALDDVDRFDRIRARAHRPDDVVQVHHVDIVVHHDHIAAEIRTRVHGRRKVTDLARVAGVALLDADRVEETRAADLVTPDALDAR